MRRPELEDGLPVPRRYAAAAALSLGTMLASVDNGMINVALPTVARDLAVEPSAAVLVVTVFQLMLIMAVLPFAALGERIGLRRLYMAGMAVYVGAAVLCFLANSLPLLIGVRALQALGAAAVFGVNSALIRYIYPRARLGAGLALNTVVATIVASVSPAIGGLLLAHLHWPWLFVAIVPFGLLALATGLRALPDCERHDEPYDMPGAAMCAAMFGLGVTGIQLAVHGGPWLAAALGIGLSLVLGTIFVRRELRQSHPVLPVDLLRFRAISLPLAASLAAHIGTTSVMLTMPFRLQHSYGFTPAGAGLMLAPWPMVMMAVAPVSGALSDRLRPGLLGSAGMAIAVPGMLLLAFLPEAPSHFDILWRFAVAGLGYALFYSPNARQIIDAAPRQRTAAAGAIAQTVRLSGQLLGSTTAAVMLVAGIGDGAAPPLVTAALAAITGLFCLAMLGTVRR